MRRSWWLAVVSACLVAGWTGALLADLSGEEDPPAETAAPPAPPPATATSPAESSTVPDRAPEPERARWIDRAELRRRVRSAGSGGDDVGVVVAPLRGGYGASAGNLQAAEAWSTIKVPLVIAAYRLADEGGVSRAEVDRLAARAIGDSDNTAAESLFAALGRAHGGNLGAAGSIEDVLREGGDERTLVHSRRTRPEFSIYGQTRWGLADGVAFFRGLARGCVEPASAATRTLDLMGQVGPDQQWGLGRAPLGGAEVALKGGWGPGTDGRYVVRQFGLVRSGRRGVVVGLMARPAGGSFEAGVRLIDALAASVARSTDVAATPATSQCDR